MAALALATAALAWIGPLARPIAAAAFGPSGEIVPAGAPIRITFDRNLDRRSVEERFGLNPPTPGRFFWDDRTLSFLPDRLLEPHTRYDVVIAEGVRDDRGRVLSGTINWSFRTRGPRLAILQSDGQSSRITLVNADGSDARLVQTIPAPVGEIVAAPDGSALVYVEQAEAGRSRLMYLDLAGAASLPLVDDPQVSAAAPSWSPTGDFIAYEVRTLQDGIAGAPRIWLAQPDGTLLGPLLSDSQQIAYGPRWSDDGNRIVFIDGQTQQLVVYSFFTDIAEPLPISSDEAAIWISEAAALVARNADPQRSQLLLIPLSDPANPRPLTDPSVAALGPAPAPNGRSIAYTQRNAPGEATIWLVALNGDPPRQLSNSGSHQDIQPLWSPDGNRIAFVRISADQPNGAAIVLDPETAVEQVVLEDVQQLVWVP